MRRTLLLLTLALPVIGCAGTAPTSTLFAGDVCTPGALDDVRVAQRVMSGDSGAVPLFTGGVRMADRRACPGSGMQYAFNGLNVRRPAMRAGQLQLAPQ